MRCVITGAAGAVRDLRVELVPGDLDAARRRPVMEGRRVQRKSCGFEGPQRESQIRLDRLPAMAELGPVGSWPPDPIQAERLVLRESAARDRAEVVELFASPEVGTTSVARDRVMLERAVPEVPVRRRPGL